MELALYIFMFVLGILFGSFYTLATHRIPKKEDILYTNSYCPNCNHKLGFWDLIPVLSYIFIGGKCRYCKKEIKPKYLMFEILSGISFVIFGYVANLNFNNMDLMFAVKLIYIVLYSTLIFIVAGIDKQHKNIEKPVIGYGIILSIIYIVYLCIVENANIYRYIIYIVMYILILLLDMIKLKKFAKNSYVTNVILFGIALTILTGELVAGITVFTSIIAVLINIVILKMKQKDVEINSLYKSIPIAYVVGMTNYIILIGALLIEKMNI